MIDMKECFFELKPRQLLCRMDHLLSSFENIHDFLADFLLLRLVFFLDFKTSDFLGASPESPTEVPHGPYSSLGTAWAAWGAEERGPW